MEDVNTIQAGLQQLWSPSKKCDVQALEQLQIQYILKISRVQHLTTYWQQLKDMYLNSRDRRRETYIIMCVWRILERHAPNIDLPWRCGINSHWHIQEAIVMFLEVVIMPHQQFKQYDMEVSLCEAPYPLIPCHQNCEILPTFI